MIKLFKYRNSSIYITIAIICALYLLYLLFRALHQYIDIALYNIPTFIITLYSIHKMMQKRLSYELTIEFKGYAGWTAFIFMMTNVICFSLIKDFYAFDYSLIKFWKNISYSAQYNNLFFFTYNILCSLVLGGLLTFNNIENVFEFYKGREQADYSPWYINSIFVITICILGFTLFKELNQIIHSYFYFLGITYVSVFIGMFISRIIICFFNTIFSCLKR